MSPGLKDIPPIQSPSTSSWIYIFSTQVKDHQTNLFSKRSKLKMADLRHLTQKSFDLRFNKPEFIANEIGLIKSQIQGQKESIEKHEATIQDLHNKIDSQDAKIAELERLNSEKEHKIIDIQEKACVLQFRIDTLMAVQPSSAQVAARPRSQAQLQP